ncbi:DUF2236 domain-containing protein [Spirillospora sp. NBC_00431]
MPATVQPPESVTWRVHIDRAMWVGGVRSLMLQALHPMTMWGVWQNSNFQRDPFGRLRRTADFVGVGTFGSPEDIEKAAYRVRELHLNAMPERLHDHAFARNTRDMLERARQRLAADGYDVSKGLYGLRDPRRWPSGTQNTLATAS